LWSYWPYDSCAAKAWGAKRVIALNVIHGKLEVAKTMGTDFTIDSSKMDTVAAIIKDSADVVIDYTGNPKAIHSGYNMIRKGDKYVMAGLPNGKLEEDPTEDIIYKGQLLLELLGD